jgi:accessory colonization factor AcfC
MKRIATIMMTLTAMAYAGIALAGPLDPECTAEKAAKGAAAKATIGVGSRCSPAEAAADSAKRVVGVDDKGPLEKRKDNKDGGPFKGDRK